MTYHHHIMLSAKKSSCLSSTLAAKNTLNVPKDNDEDSTFNKKMGSGGFEQENISIKSAINSWKRWSNMCIYSTVWVYVAVTTLAHEPSPIVTLGIVPVHSCSVTFDFHPEAVLVRVVDRDRRRKRNGSIAYWHRLVVLYPTPIIFRFLIWIRVISVSFFFFLMRSRASP